MNSSSSQSYPIELLAPAKDLQCAKAAILCGADALYIGAPKFGARVNACNTLSEIQELTEFAHIYHVKVYVTLNTIMNDDELEEAVELIWELNDCNVDGLIIQDWGLLECSLPDIPIIGSTQMNNRSLEQVQFQESVGFERTILARELSIEEIRMIREHSTIELEAFIHGALCVSYSGQCYLSYAMGGRSGNRGECAQPCRKEYTLLDENKEEVAGFQHWLSLRDFNASSNIGELLDAGVTSFKIEGRLKDENYVKNIVSHYRRLLDQEIEKRALKRSSLGLSTVDFEANPSKSFNRGFCNYFLEGRSAKMARHETPKAVGEFLGKVQAVRKDHFSIDGGIGINNGDGLLFIGSAGKVFGTQVQRAENGKIYPLDITDISSGISVYRNADREFDKQLKRSKMIRRISVNGSFQQQGKAYTISLSDDLGQTATIEVDCSECDIARDASRMEETIRKQLSRLGDSEFYLEKLNFQYDELPFIPASRLNAIRRELVDHLRQIRKDAYKGAKRKEAGKESVFPQKSVHFDGNILNSKAESFLKKHACEVVERAAESGKDLSGEKVMTTRYCVKYEMGKCPVHQKGSAIKGPMYLEDRKGRQLRLEFNCKVCQMEVYLEE